MSAMDVVAVLTKVVQEQQRLAEEQQKTIAEVKSSSYFTPICCII